MGLTSFPASRVALKCVITLLLYHVGATAPSSHSEPTHPCWAGPTARARPCLSGPESPLCASLATLLPDLQTHPESAAGRVHCVHREGVAGRRSRKSAAGSTWDTGLRSGGVGGGYGHLAGRTTWTGKAQLRRPPRPPMVQPGRVKRAGRANLQGETVWGCARVERSAGWAPGRGRPRAGTPAVLREAASTRAASPRCTTCQSACSSGRSRPYWTRPRCRVSWTRSWRTLTACPPSMSSGSKGPRVAITTTPSGAATAMRPTSSYRERPFLPSSCSPPFQT